MFCTPAFARSAEKGAEVIQQTASGLRDRAAQGVDLANRAGTGILQIRESASEAVQAVSAFANERGAH